MLKQPSMTLSTMLGAVKDAVSLMFSDGVWLTAEILHVTVKNHHYLELVEYDDNRRELAKGKGVIWKGNAGILDKFQKATGNPLSSGMKILVKASPSLHEVYGLSLVINDIDPNFTLGDMAARLNEIRQYLKEKQWWDMNRSLPSPSEFCRLAVIAPADAAGLGDFRVVADRLEAHGLCSFSYFSAAFQGEESANQIVDQMVKVLAQHETEHFDGLVLIRGGGDKAGLYQLNHRRLATAVARFPLPILIGVGHERDSVILDEIANLRFATPSLLITHIRNTIIQNAQRAQASWNRISHLANQALTNAEHLCEQQHRLVVSGASRQLEKAEGLINAAMLRTTTSSANVLDMAEQRLDKNRQIFLLHAERQCEKADQLLSAQRERVFQQAEICLQKSERLIDVHVSTAMSANPIAILGRGYAYVKQGNRFIRAATEVGQGDSVQINLKEGSIMATVEGTANA
jgi:exodeoxyribonuclease VII large subunit